MTPRALPTRAAAEYLGLTVGQLYERVRAGAIAVVHTGAAQPVRRRLPNGRVVAGQYAGRLVFAVRDLDAWLEAHRTPARVGAVADRIPGRPALPPALEELPEVHRYA